MGRNDIRLRRNSMSSGRIARHRNYGDLMARHEREVRLKRIFRIFVYFLIIAFLVVMFFIVKRVEKKDRPAKATTGMIIRSGDASTTR